MQRIGTSALVLLGLLAGAGQAADGAAAAAQDRAVIEAMRAQQIDLAKPQEIEFAFYFPDKQGARKVMAVLAGEGYAGELRTEGTDAFILFARRTMLVQLEALATLRTQFEALAKEAGGTYDGWGLP